MLSTGSLIPLLWVVVKQFNSFQHSQCIGCCRSSIGRTPPQTCLHRFTWRLRQGSTIVVLVEHRTSEFVMYRFVGFDESPIARILGSETKTGERSNFVLRPPHTFCQSNTKDLQADIVGGMVDILQCYIQGSTSYCKNPQGSKALL